MKTLGILLSLAPNLRYDIPVEKQEDTGMRPSVNTLKTARIEEEMRR